MMERLSSVSVVIVVRDESPAAAEFESLSRQLELSFTDFEFVIVGNEVGETAALELKGLVDHVPDSLAVFLGERVHDDVARLIGIDHAVSDYVLFCVPTPAEIAAIPLLVAPIQSGIDLAIGRLTSPAGRRKGLGRFLVFLFGAIFRLVTGKVFEKHPTAFRLLSRAAALYIATRRDGEVLVRARTLGSGFPAAEVSIPGDEEEGRKRRKSSLGGDLGRAARLIATGSTTLLRASSYVALVGGLVSAVYALYVVLVYFFYSDVQPGWTTLSLQLSGMMLLFSIQFLLLAEHVMQLVADSGVSARHHYVIREIRSSLSRRSSRLNVVNQHGQYEIGAPRENEALRNEEGLS